MYYVLARDPCSFHNYCCILYRLLCWSRRPSWPWLFVCWPSNLRVANFLVRIVGCVDVVDTCSETSARADWGQLVESSHSVAALVGSTRRMPRIAVYAPACIRLRAVRVGVCSLIRTGSQWHRVDVQFLCLFLRASAQQHVDEPVGVVCSTDCWLTQRRMSGEPFDDIHQVAPQRGGGGTGSGEKQGNRSQRPSHRTCRICHKVVVGNIVAHLKTAHPRGQARPSPGHTSDRLAADINPSSAVEQRKLILRPSLQQARAIRALCSTHGETPETSAGFPSTAGLVYVRNEVVARRFLSRFRPSGFSSVHPSVQSQPFTPKLCVVVCACARCCRRHRQHLPNIPDGFLHVALADINIVPSQLETVLQRLQPALDRYLRRVSPK